jgi:enterochelin esterase-like enzyme
MKSTLWIGPVLALAAGGLLYSQQPAGPGNGAAPKAKGNSLIKSLAELTATMKGKLEKVQVHGKSLEGNLEGDSPDRDVFIYLPPSYATNTNRRYPVVYMLHGYGLAAQQWVGFPDVSALERDLAAGTAKEMILVSPDAKTLHNGSWYSNSLATGDWETYLTEELVGYVDSHYRTIANRASRGLMGHSMGGYATWRLGMKHPDVYSSIYGMSACCMLDSGAANADMATVEAIKTKEEAAKGSQGVRGIMARAAAWSANPDNPPFYFDLPVKNGQPVPAIAAKWNANSILAMLDQYANNLKKMKAIAMDVGLQDNLLGPNQDLDKALTKLGVAHTFETYEGDHNGKVRVRFETKVLPFFSNQLSFTAPKK